MFQTAFDEYEAIPDASVKENIDRAIAAKEKKRRFFIFFFPFFAFSCILATITYFYLPKEQSEHITKTESNKSNETIQNINEEKTINSVSNTEVKHNKTIENKTEKSAPNLQHFHVIEQQKIQKSQLNSEVLKSSEKALNSILESEQLQKPTNVDQTSIESALVSIPVDEVASTNQTPVDTTTAREAKDSISVVDSKEIPIAIDLTPVLESKWYLTVLGGWEGSSGKPFQQQENTTDLSLVGTELARVQSKSFYGKMEVNRKLTTKFHLLAGIGFKSTLSKQYGSLYSLDSIYVENEITSTPSGSFSNFIRHEIGEQQFRVNSLLFPIGLAYDQSIGRNFHFRLSLGTEFLVGWKKTLKSQPIFSAPTFRSFGWNAWVRPEIHYSLKHIRFIAFGTVSHTFTHQLNWNIDTQRRPSFGGGIGLVVCIRP